MKDVFRACPVNTEEESYRLNEEEVHCFHGDECKDGEMGLLMCVQASSIQCLHENEVASMLEETKEILFVVFIWHQR